MRQFSPDLYLGSKVGVERCKFKNVVQLIEADPRQHIIQTASNEETPKARLSPDLIPMDRVCTMFLSAKNMAPNALAKRPTPQMKSKRHLNMDCLYHGNFRWVVTNADGCDSKSTRARLA